MLDVNLGTYPYVTSSSTHVAQVYSGVGVDFAHEKVIGVLKAYSTQVGAGPFLLRILEILGVLYSREVMR